MLRMRFARVVCSIAWCLGTLATLAGCSSGPLAGGLTPTRSEAATAPATTPMPTPSPVASWMPVPSFPFAQAVRIVISPTGLAHPDWGVGCGQGSSGSPQGIAVTHDAGTTWTVTGAHFAFTVPCQALSIDPTDASLMLAAGVVGGMCHPTTGYETRDGGATWQELPLHYGTIAELAGIAWINTTLFLGDVYNQGIGTCYQPPDVAQLLAFDGGVPRAVNNAGLFSGLPAGSTIAGIFAFHTTLYVSLRVGPCIPGQRCQYVTATSQDLGMTWTHTPSAYQGTGIQMVAMGFNGTCYGLSLGLLSGSSPVQTLYVSTNGGLTWTLAFPQLADLSWLAETPDGTLLVKSDAIYEARAGQPTLTRVTTGDVLSVEWDAQGHPVALWGNSGDSNPAQLERYALVP